MNKAVLHGVKRKDDAINPIIEITGYPDCGKKLVAELVAKRIGAYTVHFPILDLTSFTGNALLHCITTKPKVLEQEPLWWSHLYAANLQEKRELIIGLQKLSPVVVVNYVTGAKIWAKATGIKKLTSFFGDLPVPIKSYGLYGPTIETPGNTPNNFSRKLISSIQSSVLRKTDPNYILVKMEPSTRLWETLNNAAIKISGDIKERYGGYLDEGALYDTTLNYV